MYKEKKHKDEGLGIKKMGLWIMKYGLCGKMKNGIMG